MRQALVLAAVAVVCAAAASVVSADNIVNTASGPVEGYVSGDVQIFRGIPFAAPPTGDNRLKAPQPVTPWTSPRPCLSQANVCPQFRITDFLFLGNEDCLYLDVYVPQNAGPGPLPVMFWIFGGGWILGDGYEFGLYDATNFASKYGVIVVAPNYRLAALGFLALDQLRKEDSYNSTGNYALQDQRAALHWTQTNIANFGGDPAKVTIFGESAGAFSVCWHLASPLSKGLFRAALMESGSCDSPYFFRDYPDARDWSEQYAYKVGCDPISDQLPACLRALPTGKIMGHILDLFSDEQKGQLQALAASGAAGGGLGNFVPALYPFMPWGAAIDNTPAGLLDTPLGTIRAGNWHDVPVLFGTNHDEGSIFEPAMFLLVPGLVFPVDRYDLNRSLWHFFPNQTIVSAVMDMYPISAYNNSYDLALQALMRDDFFVCGTKRTLKAINAAGQPNAWMYQWVYKGDWIEDALLGNYHSGELEFVFGNEWPSPLIHPFSQNDRLMSDSFGTYWSEFAKYLNPNGNGTSPSGQPNWPAFDPTNQRHITMSVPPVESSHLYDKECALWDEIAIWTKANGMKAPQLKFVR